MSATLDWNELGPFTHFLVHTLHYVALIFMILAYTIKIRSILQKPPAVEGTPPRGDHKKAIRYSYLLLARPNEMESTRRHWFRWLEFSVFHVAMALGIAVAFTMPWAHASMTSPFAVYVQYGLFGAAALIGLSRLVRRILDPAMRAISTPDDYFCLILLTAWMASGVFNAAQTKHFWLLAYFGLATFFLFYVPFSKISHYICWPFLRFYMGKHFGHRGVYPKKRIAGA